MTRSVGSSTRSRPVSAPRQRIWNSIVVHKRFSTLDIQATAEVHTRNLNLYLRALERAGYLRIIRPRQTRSMGHAVWTLIRHTGPKHPVVRRDGSVFDPNNGKLYEYATTAQEAADVRAEQQPELARCIA